MDTQSEKDLEFPRILNSFAGNCLSIEGKQKLLSLPFCTSEQELSERQEVIGECIKLLSSGMVAHPDSFPDISHTLSSLNDIRVSLDGGEIYQVGLYIDAAKLLCRFTKSSLEEKKVMPHLFPLFGDGVDQALEMLSDEIKQTLESDGKVKLTHPLIAPLVRQVENARQGRVSFARQYINSHREQVQNESGAYRDGRLVIPMRSDRTSKDQGYVASSSTSGNTLFLEPFRLVELNNEVSLAQQQILIESAKLVKGLSDKIKRFGKELRLLSEQVGEADLWYSLAISAHLGDMHPTQYGIHVKLLMARHPLLGNSCVPITIDLDQSTKAVVLTGPNAGGKTVTIKTIGLLAMINQLCGYVPANEGSVLPLFDNILTEIGDEQDIDAGLSTFSGQMHRVSQALKVMTPKSLVIFDELGSGTDPVEGSALARAILQECLDCGCLTLITSHHGVLKEFAYARNDVMNASMAFDDKSHEPTFHVVQGVPGDSHAIDTAVRQNLPPRVIEHAKSYLGTSAVQIGEVIKGLEHKRQELLEREHLIREKEQEIARLQEELQRKELQLRQQKLQIVDNQDTELARFLRNKNKEIEHLLNDLRTSGNLTQEKEAKARLMVNTLKSKKEETENWLGKEEKRLTRTVPNEVFQVGDHILVGSMKRSGIVTKILKKDVYEIQVGSIRMNAKGKDLARDGKAEEKGKVVINYTGSTPKPLFELDLRGCTLEESLRKMDLQIESCLVHGLTEFGVIHGFGDGILSKGIREYLDRHPSVKSHRFAPPNDGGMGKTYVEL